MINNTNNYVTFTYKSTLYLSVVVSLNNTVKLNKNVEI